MIRDYVLELTQIIESNIPESEKRIQYCNIMKVTLLMH